MRILGLDVGTKTIGVAVSDPTECIACGLTTIRRQSIEKDLDALKKIQEEYKAETVIIGLPKKMDGTIGDQAIFVQKLGDKIQKALNIEIKYIDERLTTVQANRALQEYNISRQKRKNVIDKQAAILILQSFLDQKRNSA